MERSDKLRRRPDKIRYFFLAVSNVTLHTGMSYGALMYIRREHTLEDLYFADLKTMRIVHVTEPIEDFLARWRKRYNDPTWCYETDIWHGFPVPTE